ncbi:hypothetical protein C0J52_11779 [Blattella germanica]|nr:hypothetical protein C0J52_11779 [Blattella germanica]
MKIWYCGFNGFGQLPSESCSTVNQLTQFPDLNVQDVKLSWSYMTMLTDVGVYLSGFVEGCPNQLKKLPSFFNNISQVSCCERHLLCVETAGKGLKYCKSTGAQSRLVEFSAEDRIERVSCGYTFDAFVLSSGQTMAALSVIHFPTEGKVVDVVCGNEHCLLLTTSGSVFSWGNGSRGQLGHGDLESEEGKARQIEMLAGLRVIQIAAGAWHSAAVTDADSKLATNSLPVLALYNASNMNDIVGNDGCVWGCGWNAFGQLGRPVKELAMTWKMLKLSFSNRTACGVRCGAWSTVILSNVK